MGAGRCRQCHVLAVVEARGASRAAVDTSGVRGHRAGSVASQRHADQVGSGIGCRIGWGPVQLRTVSGIGPVDTYGISCPRVGRGRIDGSAVGGCGISGARVGQRGIGGDGIGARVGQRGVGGPHVGRCRISRRCVHRRKITGRRVADGGISDGHVRRRGVGASRVGPCGITVLRVGPCGINGCRIVARHVADDITFTRST